MCTGSKHVIFNIDIGILHRFNVSMYSSACYIIQLRIPSLNRVYRSQPGSIAISTTQIHNYEYLK